MQTPRARRVIANVALASLSAVAAAQTTGPFKSTCQAIGMNSQEALGDRDGHALVVNQYSCQSEGGFFDGAITTGLTLWETDKGTFTSLSANGVMRKPGLLVVFELTDATNGPVVTDGKVTGFAGTAKGVYRLATGAANSLSGKTFTVKFRTVGRGQFVTESTLD